MLRNIVIAIAVACLAGGAIVLILGQIGPALLLGVWGAILLAGTLFEKVRYKPVLAEKPANAVRTDEKFFDEATRKSVTVYVDPTTGERSYVEE